MASKPKAKRHNINDILDFIYSNEEKIPERFIFEKSHLSENLIYMIERFHLYPKILIYLNKYNITMYNPIYEDPFKFLLFLKQIVRETGIPKYKLKWDFSKIMEFIEARKIQSKVEELALSESKQEIDIISDINLRHILSKEKKRIASEERKIIKQKDSSFNDKKDVVKNIIESQREKNKESKISDQLLNELNEEIVKELELTLIDTFVNDQKNEVVYIFLDKNYNKKYYKEQFEADIYISTMPGIINNDYLEKITEENLNKFINYKIPNYWGFQQLKQNINKNYKRFMNQF
jgi:hypothetical protein